MALKQTGAVRDLESKGDGAAQPGDLSAFRGLHAGQSLVVCGCGASLADFRPAANLVTIGVNDVGRLFDPTYLVVLNKRQQFSGERFRYVEQSRARAIFTQLDLGIRHPNIVRIRLGRFGGTDFSNPQALNYTRNSPYVALCLAIHMGAKWIGLIGVDFTEHHFFAETGRHPLTDQFAQIDSEYLRFAQACAKLGIEVVNLSPQSRLTAFPKVSHEAFFARGQKTRVSLPNAASLNIVSYATTPVAGVPAILARCIEARTEHHARCVWARNDYGNGVTFMGDIEWSRHFAAAEAALAEADLVIVHNGKVDPRHLRLLAEKPVVTMAHNYAWNVDQQFVRKGFPGVVVGQYQATLPEFAGWSIVPNPVPWWESAYQPEEKNDRITICYTPSGKHERYPQGHRLYWHAKGYETTMRVLDRLKTRHALQLNVIRDHQVSHSEALAMKRVAHIVIDECVTGSYHRNSLEGLATGCVVVNGMGLSDAITKSFVRCIDADAQQPFEFADLNNLESVLEQWIVCGLNRLLAKGSQNRVWMEQLWDFSKQWKRFWQPICDSALTAGGFDAGKRGFATTGNVHELKEGGYAMAKVTQISQNRCESSSSDPGFGQSPETIAISVVLPVHENSVDLLARTLLSLNAQSMPGAQFEVIVAADGGDPDGRLLETIEATPWRFSCRLIESNRTQGDLAHRNHARNAGCKVARGDLVWPLDADFMLPKHALSHAWHEYQHHANRKLDCILTPCLAAIALPAQEWLSRTRDALACADSARLWQIGCNADLDKNLDSGFCASYKGGPPSSRRITHLGEGMPLIPSQLFRALEGFDEAFVGWGGNKQEFVARLRGLRQAQLIEFRVLTSVMALHQPHALDPDKRKESPLRNRNARMLQVKINDIRNNAEWWRREKAAAAKIIRTRDFQTRSLTKPYNQGMQNRIRIGMLSLNDRSKGLFRDVEILAWAIERANREHKLHSLTRLFAYSANPQNLVGPPDKMAAAEYPNTGSSVDAAPAGTLFGLWLDSVDMVVVFESWLAAAMDLAKKKGKRIVYVPNLDWSAIDSSVERWIDAVRSSGVEVWSKTRCTYEILSSHGITSNFMHWSIPDPVVRDRAVVRRPLQFLFLAGNGGWRDRRGLDIALKAFEIARRAAPELRLRLHSIKALKDYGFDIPGHSEGISASEGLLPRSGLADLFDEADVLLYPSRWEGFGLSLLEGLHAGLPVIATDGPPMNELIEHAHNGLLIAAEDCGAMRLAPWRECNAQAMAQAMIELSLNEDLRRRLTCPEPAQLVARQHRFIAQVAARLSFKAPSCAVVFCARQQPDRARRSEAFWSDALRDHGYEVDLVFHDASPQELQRIFERQPEFVLVGKVTNELIHAIRALTKAPIVLWHHDLVDYTQDRLRWFQSVVPDCDLVAIPESGRQLVPGCQDRIISLLPGCAVDGDRGPGHRPIAKAEPQSDEVVFLGRLDPIRRALLAACRKVAPIRVYTQDSLGSPSGMEKSLPCWGKEAADVIRKSAFVLSISARNDLNYTSNRLFNSAGAGGCVLVKSFPGLDKLYTKDCLSVFDDPKEAASLIVKLKADPQHCRALRVAAEEHTWRHHTWLDRVSVLLSRIQGLKPRTPVHGASVQAHETLRFWETRAQKHGICAVGHHRWQMIELDQATDSAWNRMQNVLDVHEFSQIGTILDFGCGAGRFTDRLAKLGARVTGVDISSTLLEFARKGCSKDQCEFERIEPGRELPFQDHSFDALWTFTVLQHIPDALFEVTVAEIQRVLKRHALIVLFENTLNHRSRTSTSGHVVFRRPKEYVRAFPGVREIDQVMIEKEQHSVFAGRLK